MKRKFLAFFVMLLTIGFLTNSAYAQCSKEKTKESNCCKSKNLDEASNKEKKNEVKTEVAEHKECAGEHSEVKIHEIEKLHTCVAELWHKNYPAYNLKKMKKDVVKITKMFTKLEALKMPKGCETKVNDYKAALTEFKKSINDLNSYLSSLKKAEEKDADLKNKVTKMHTDFHTITEIF
jgi:hypothetical protein